LGLEQQGELGDGSATQQELPIQVPMLSGMVAIAAGGEHSLALHHSGMVRAWGANGFGQIGNDTTSASQPNPTQVVDGPGSTNPLNLITAIAAGETHSMAIRADGEVRAWGYNNAGRLGRRDRDGSPRAGRDEVFQRRRRIHSESHCARRRRH